MLNSIIQLKRNSVRTIKTIPFSVSAIQRFKPHCGVMQELLHVAVC